jgi:putative transposase
MFQFFLKPLRQFCHITIGKLENSFKKHFNPAKASLSLGTFTDLGRTIPSLVAENGLLRQQLIVLQRQVSKPKLRPIDRVILVVLAGLVTNWRQTLLILQPQTLLKWYRAGFKLFWKFKAKGRKPKIAEETILLIKKMASENRLWGAERIQGELLKHNIRVSKRTIQK